ncbi:hypothetical protein C8A05DRAFT_44810 [Staphylotrichum tortipilum]|uniref:NAD(P)-binding protein n=1 Tax=Staphylotrichum tortipilum TaxID=2831512 RepID=A0AAN6MIL3_9PEZI|nr:hypothetical protein C8A05DRAFT_44810 [Staphylotrichum longicolle]
MAPPQKLTVLITGCTPGGMGAALAVAFHSAGHHVFATARNPSKLAPLADQGIQTLPLDITSATSITAAVAAVSSSLSTEQGLDILVNNAAGSYAMPLADAALSAARDLFEVNVWAHLAVTQAFLPLLLKSAAAGGFTPIVANHTSVGSVAALPFQGVYNASKAALAMLTSTLRIELAPLGVRVVEMKTGGVRTNIIGNSSFNAGGERLPGGSVYGAARGQVEKIMSQEGLVGIGVPPEVWAKEVVGALLGRRLPRVLWKGEGAGMARVVSALPFSGLVEMILERVTGFGAVKEALKKAKQE